MSKKEKKNFITRAMENRQAMNDAEFEYKASLTPDERHAYEKAKRRRTAKAIVFCGCLAGGAYALGRLNKEGNKIIEEIGVNNLDEAFENSTTDIAKDISEFLSSEKEDVAELTGEIVKEVI